jgi:hypothetical protein
MKRILVADKGMFKEWYGEAAPDGGPLRSRRLEQAGRLELVRILNDPPAYWFVLIRNFDMSTESADRRALAGLTTPWGNGVWRFLEFEKAKARFAQLSALPIFVAERDRAQKTREKAAERLRKVGYTFPKKLAANPA